MNVRLSPRDMVALTILAEMYGAPLDVVAQLLGVSMNRAYRIAARWKSAHMISDKRTRPVPGPTWVFPSKSAAEALLGRSVSHWVPTPKMAAHTKAVLQLRLAVVGTDLDRWISERQLRSELPIAKAGESRPHVHDGRYYTGSGDLWAVEVELKAKNGAAARAAVYQAWQVAKAAECAGVAYFCRGEGVKSVIRTAAQGLEGGPQLRAIDLDDFLAKHPPMISAPGQRPGLRVIEGGATDSEISPAAGRPAPGKAV